MEAELEGKKVLLKQKDKLLEAKVALFGYLSICRVQLLI